jgi:hypothetical protein
VLVIDVDEIRFEEKQEHLSLVIDKVDALIHGLF